MPRAWAAMVTRVWSSVASAVLNPVPGAPIMRDAGIRTSSRITWRVGDPLIPSFLSFGPERDPFITLFHDKSGNAVGPARRVRHRHEGVVLPDARVRDPHLDAVEHVMVTVEDRAGLHAHGVGAGLGLGQAPRGIASPRATGGSTRLELIEAGSSHGSEASLLTAGIREVEAQARATSSITIAVASASAPTPSYASGTCGVEVRRDERLVRVPRELIISSVSAAFGATFASQTSRTAARKASRSSVGRYRSSKSLTKRSVAPHC